MEQNKAVVRLLVDEVLNGGRLEVIDELYAAPLASEAKRWIAPFQASFPDMHLDVVELIAEVDQIVGRFTCSGTRLGEWLRHAATGRRFEAVDEVSIYRLSTARSSISGGLKTPSDAWSSSDYAEARHSASASH